MAEGTHGTRLQEMQKQLAALQSDTHKEMDHLRLDLEQCLDLRFTELRDSMVSSITEQIRFLVPTMSSTPPPPASPPPIPASSGILSQHPPHHPHRSDSQQSNRLLKLQFPCFASGDPTDWLFAVEQYFRYYETPSADKLLLTAMHLDSPASRWYQGLARDNLIRDWPAFMVAIQRRFGPTEYDDPVGNLTKLVQTGTVLEFQAAFETYASKVPGLSPQFLTSTFTSGLKTRIKRAVIAQRPRDFHEAFALARVFEEQYPDDRVPPRPSPYRPPPLQQNTSLTTNPTSLPIKRLTPTEMQARREKGLCYNCDEKFVFGHKCKGRSTLLFLEGEYDEVDSPPPLSDPPIDSEISFHALFGHRPSRALRLQGFISNTAL